MALSDHWNGVDDAATASAKAIVGTNGILPAGTLVAISICLNAGTTTATCNDGQGNTYGSEFTAVVNGANSVTHLLLTSRIANAIPAANTWNFTLGASRLRFTAAFGAFDDVLSDVVDGTVGTGTNTSSTVAPSASGDPATTRSLTLLSGGTQSNVSFSVAGSQALADIAKEGTSSGERTAFLSYEYVVNPGAQSPTGNLSGSAIWCAAVTNYDAAQTVRRPSILHSQAIQTASAW